MGDVIELSPYMGDGAVVFSDVVARIEAKAIFRRGRGALLEASFIQSGDDLTEKLLHGKLAGPDGDIVLRACEVPVKECGEKSSGRLLMHIQKFRVLDPAAADEQALDEGDGDEDFEAPQPAARPGSGRHAGAARGADVVGGTLAGSRGGGGAPAAGARGGDFAGALRDRLHDLRQKYTARGAADTAGKAKPPARVQERLREATARFDPERDAARLPGPRPGVRGGGALPMVDGGGIVDPAAESDGQGLFRVAPTRAVEDDIVAFARAHPGQLLGLAVEEIDRYLAVREGATDAEQDAMASRFVTYLTSVFHAAHPPSQVGERATSELRTIAEALDALTRGNLARAGDILTQRFKSVEMQATGESGTLARQHELISPTRGGLAREAERAMAAKSEIFRAKLADIAKPKDQR